VAKPVATKARRSFPIRVVTPFLAEWRAPVSWTLIQRAVASRAGSGYNRTVGAPREATR
jgi:hypothetical protein